MKKTNKSPLWFIILTLIFFIFWNFINFIYLLIQPSLFISNQLSINPFLSILALLLILSGWVYVIITIIFIFKIRKNKIERIIYILTVLGILSIILPSISSVLGFENNLNSLILNLTPIIPLVLSFYMLVTRNLKKEKITNHLSITKFVIFSFLSIGLYIPYWYFKNLEYIEEFGKKDILVGWRLIAFFIPFVNFYIVYDSFNIIREMMKDKLKKVEWSAGWITFWFFFLLFLRSIVLEIFDPGFLLFSLIYLGTLFIVMSPLITIQDSLNDYWDKVQKRIKTKEGLTRGEIVFVIVALIIWGFILLPSMVS